MVKKNIYLSLDDLHKLYGISPAIINAIKKKRKKRRNKKLKINNGTMGNKPTNNDGLIGSSSALAISTQQLNKANIDKRIEDINKNNLMIDNKRIENKKEDTPIELTIYNKLKNKELLTPDELVKYEEIQNIMIPPTKTKMKPITRRKAFEVTPSPINPLSNVSSNVMGRNQSNNNIIISDNDNTLDATIGTSSDNFINSNVEEFLTPELPSENINLPIDENVNLPIEENIDLPIEETLYMSMGDFNRDQLQQIARDNNISYQNLISNHYMICY